MKDLFSIACAAMLSILLPPMPPQHQGKIHSPKHSEFRRSLGRHMRHAAIATPQAASYSLGLEPSLPPGDPEIPVIVTISLGPAISWWTWATNDCPCDGAGNCTKAPC